jgi:hypothetical protein
MGKRTSVWPRGGVGLLGVALLVASSGCVVERDLYTFELGAALQDPDPLQGVTYTVVLSWQPCEDPPGGTCQRYYRVIDEVTAGSAVTVDLAGEIEADECLCVDGFDLGAWRDDDGDGEFAGQWLEPCAAVQLEEPFERDEPIDLTLELGGCQAVPIMGGLAPVTCCRPG